VAKPSPISYERAYRSGRGQVIASKPTDNTRAYDALPAWAAYSLKTASTPANFLAAQKYLREAVRLDPNFALSWALLSYIKRARYISHIFNQRSLSVKRRGRRPKPRLPSAQSRRGHIGQGILLYACLKDYNTAVRYFEQARQFLPNSSKDS